MFETLEIDKHTITLSKDEFLELLEYARNGARETMRLCTGNDHMKASTDYLDIRSVIRKVDQ